MRAGAPRRRDRSHQDRQIGPAGWGGVKSSEAHDRKPVLSAVFYAGKTHEFFWERGEHDLALKLVVFDGRSARLLHWVFRPVDLKLSLCGRD